MQGGDAARPGGGVAVVGWGRNGGKDGDGVGWIVEWGRDFIGLREWCGGRFDDDGDGGDAMACGGVRLETAQAVRGDATARQ